MKKFNHVIVRRPCRAMVDGITSAPELGRPDYELALKEHDAYIEALKQCDVDVTILESDERYPDSFCGRPGADHQRVCDHHQSGRGVQKRREI